MLCAVAFWFSIWVGSDFFNYLDASREMLGIGWQCLIVLSVQVLTFWAFHTYSGILLGLCRLTLGDTAMAQDIVQETFLKAWQKGGFRKETEKAWLIRVTQNACRKHFRSMWIKLTVLYDDTLYKEQEVTEDGIASAAEA